MAICLEPDCPAIIPDGQARCDEHRRARSRVTNKLYQRERYGPEWPAISKRYLRAHPLCECAECAALPADQRDRATEVDHRTPLRAFTNRRAAHHESNLQALSKRHHSRKTIDEVIHEPRRRAQGDR